MRKNSYKRIVHFVAHTHWQPWNDRAPEEFLRLQLKPPLGEFIKGKLATEHLIGES